MIETITAQTIEEQLAESLYPIPTAQNEPRLDNQDSASNRRRFRRVAGTAGLMFHEQITLGGELVGSDIKAEFSGGPKPTLVEETDDEAIDQTYNMLEGHSVGNGLYKDGLFYSTFYTDTRVIDVLYTLSLLPGNQAQNYHIQYEDSLNASQAYWENGSANYRAGYSPAVSAFTLSNDRLDDDNLWMGLIKMREASENSEALKRSEQIFSLAISQWDQKDGGIYWQEQTPGANTDRCVVSNAPAVQLGVELYQKTGNEKYLKWSEKIFNWLENTLLNKSNGLYNDHINGKTINTNIWTYVQGTMIGAMTALNEVDPDKYPLRNAVDLAQRAMDYFAANKSYGNSAFDSIFFENLLNLAHHYNNDQFTNEAKTALGLSIAAIPRELNDLTDVAGALELRSLQALPVSEYGQLFSTGKYKPKASTTTA